MKLVKRNNTETVKSSQKCISVLFQSVLNCHDVQQLFKTQFYVAKTFEVIIIIIIILLQKSVNGCNDDSFGGHCVLEGDRVPLLKGHGQTLEHM